MRQFVFFILVFSCLKSFSQETDKVAPIVSDSFVVIVNVAEQKSEQTAQAIQSIAKSLNLRYLGYCTTQKCVIVSASSRKFVNLQRAVIEILKKQYGSSVILGFSHNFIGNFWQQCGLSTPQEYRYFKTTYGK